MKKLLKEKFLINVLKVGLKEDPEEYYYDIESISLDFNDLKNIEKEVQKLLQKIEEVKIIENSQEVQEYIEKLEEIEKEAKKEIKNPVLVKVVISGKEYFDILPKEILEKNKEIEILEIFNISSAHWNNKIISRIHWRVFSSKEEYENFIKNLQKVQQYDHRFIGEQLELFSFYEEIIGSGLPLFHPKGTVIKNKLIEFIRVVNDFLEFQEVTTPHIYKLTTMKISGHFEKYRENMFTFKVDDEEYAIKPMNCPGHILIYKSKVRSYKDLPIRYAEFATVYRNEITGALKGLLRVRSITQDDHHIFARPDQIKEEVKKLVHAILSVYKTLGFEEVKLNLSTKPDQYIGSDELWEIAEEALRKVLEELKIEYNLKEKEGAFYGPKIDFDVKDIWNRWWQLGTIQLDFFQPMRFKAVYKTSDDKEEFPVIIHSAFLGSLERFTGIFIEQTKGLFPLYFAPVQVAIIPVSEKNLEYAIKIERELKLNKIRTELYSEERTLSYRIRKAEANKVPIMVIIGEKEEKEGALSVRFKGGEVTKMHTEELIKEVKKRSEKTIKDLQKYLLE